MGTFFKILLYAVLIFYLFSLVINYVFKRKVRKLQRQATQDNTDHAKEAPQEQQVPHIDPNIGEYTEFEEVE